MRYTSRQRSEDQEESERNIRQTNTGPDWMRETEANFRQSRSTFCEKRSEYQETDPWGSNFGSKRNHSGTNVLSHSIWTPRRILWQHDSGNKSKSNYQREEQEWQEEVTVTETKTTRKFYRRTQNFDDRSGDRRFKTKCPGNTSYQFQSSQMPLSPFAKNERRQKKATPSMYMNRKNILEIKKLKKDIKELNSKASELLNNDKEPYTSEKEFGLYLLILCDGNYEALDKEKETLVDNCLNYLKSRTTKKVESVLDSYDIY